MNTLKFGNGEWYGKKDTILAYNDENSNFKPLPFSFDRDTLATRVNKDGLIETVGSGEPRIDYKDDSKGALKLEPSRTNSITYSNDFSKSIYGKINLTITANQGISPDGTQNANLLVPNAAVGNRYLTNSTGSNLKINTVFLKKKELRYVKVGNAQSNVLVDLENGTISADSVSTNNFTIENYGNGWYRVSCYSTLDVNLQIQIFFGIDGSGSNIATNGTDGVYIYGFEIQNGSYATSYIPTQGGAVTRVVDVCNNGANEQVINSTEGVLYFEGSALANDGTDRKITLSDNSLNNAINFGYSRFSGNINAEVISGGVLQTSGFGATGVTQDNNNKFALSWGNGISKFYVNGTLASSHTNVTSPIGMNVLNFSLSSGFQKMFSNTKDLRVYNTALTDQELINLTTI